MRDLPAIVILSLGVSLSATAIATVLGFVLASVLALGRFRGRGTLIVLVNALLGLPPVVIGLFLYLLLSHDGPLGELGLLFTPAAMVIAQTVLAVPIVAALAHRALAAGWLEYGRVLRACGAGRLQSLPSLFALSRDALMTAVLAGFGRTISEVGAILIVGGNIAGYTRTMTTAIALQTSMGNLALALALGLILIGISIAVSAAAFILHPPADRAVRRAPRRAA